MAVLPNLELIICTAPWEWYWVILLGDTRGLHYKVRSLVNINWSAFSTIHGAEPLPHAKWEGMSMRGFNNGNLCNRLRAPISSAKNVVVNASNWRSARVRIAGLAEINTQFQRQLPAFAQWPQLSWLIISLNSRQPSASRWTMETDGDSDGTAVWISISHMIELLGCIEVSLIVLKHHPLWCVKFPLSCVGQNDLCMYYTCDVFVWVWISS